jgi:hypothetical protein
MATSLLSEALIANTAGRFYGQSPALKVVRLPNCSRLFPSGSPAMRTPQAGKSAAIFVRNTAQLVFRKAEQVRGLSPVLQILGHHYRSRPPPNLLDRSGVHFYIRPHRVLNLGVARSSFPPTL